MIRKKLSICVLTILLVGAGSSIYAKTNPVQNLSDWYKSSFQQKSENLGTVTATEIIKGLADFNQFVSGSKSTLNAMIVALGDDGARDTQTEIEMHHAKLVQELNETVVDLQQENFDDYVDKQTIEVEITREVEKIVEELVNE